MDARLIHTEGFYLTHPRVVAEAIGANRDNND